MKYLEWNTKLYNYFFEKNDNEVVYLSVTKETLGIISNLNEDDAYKDFIDAVKSFPTKEENIDNKFNFLLTKVSNYEKPTNVLIKAHNAYIAKINKAQYQPSGHGLRPIPVFNGNIPPFLGYLCSLILFLDEYDFWKSYQTCFGKVGQSSLYVDIMLKSLKESCPKFDYFEIYKESNNKQYVGKLLSQIPFTKDELCLITNKLKIEEISYETLQKGEIDFYELFNKYKYDFNKYTLEAILGDHPKHENFRRFYSKYLIEEIKEYKLDEIQNHQDVLVNKKNSLVILETTYVITKELDGFKINHAIILPSIDFEFNINFVLNNETKKELDLSGRKITFNYGALPVKVILIGNSEAIKEGEYINEDTNQKIKINPFKSNQFFFYREEIEYHPYFLILPKGEVRFIGELNKLGYLSIDQHNKYEDFAIDQTNVSINNIKYYLYFSFRFGNNNNKIKIKDTSITLIDKDLRIKLYGITDGIQGQTSYRKGYPIYPSIIGGEVSKIRLIKNNNKLILEQILPSNILSDESHKLLFENLDEGNYHVECYNNTDVKLHLVNDTCFKITNQTEIDKRTIFNLPKLNISENYSEIEKLETIDVENPNVDYTINKEQIVKLLDTLIFTGGYYNQDKLNQLIEFHFPEVESNVGVKFIKRGLVLGLDAIGLIDFDFKTNRILSINKPTVLKGNINDCYFISGALTSNEYDSISKLKGIYPKTNVYFHSEKISSNKKIRLKIELPDTLYTCSNHGYNNLAQQNTITEKHLSKPAILNFLLQQKVTWESIEKENTTGKFETYTEGIIIDNNNTKLYLNINSSTKVSIYNPLNYRVENISQNQIDNLFETPGNRLLLIEKTRSIRTNYVEKYWICFSKYNQNNNWEYFIFDNTDHRWARFYYINKYTNFDYTLMSGVDVEILNKSIQNNHQKNINEENKNSSHLLQIITYCPKANPIHNLLKYDEEKNILAINKFNTLPKQLFRALIMATGSFPKERIFDVSNNYYHLEKRIFNESSKTENIKIPYFIFEGIDKNSAELVSKLLLGERNINQNLNHTDLY